MQGWRSWGVHGHKILGKAETELQHRANGRQFDIYVKLPPIGPVLKLRFRFT